MLPIERHKLLDKYLLNRNGTSSSTSNNICIETLIDSLIVLYDECCNSSLRRHNEINYFIDYVRPVVDKIRELRLNKNDFDIVKVIGRGSFGEVAFVRMKNTQNLYAMKILNKWDILKRAQTACYREERDVLVNGDPQWITKLHYAFQDNENLYLVMDYYCGGDLLTLLSKHDYFTEDVAKFYISELILAVDSLHKIGYVHRDIKPDNVLLDINGHVRLADFGSCLKLKEDGSVFSTVAVGTPDYIPPEILTCMDRNGGKYGVVCDYWSVGVVLYEMLFEKTPFYAESLQETYGKIMNHEQLFSIPHNDDKFQVSNEARDLISRLICKKETRLGRNGLNDFKTHDFFNDIDWSNIRNKEPPFIPSVQDQYDTSNFDAQDDDMTRNIEPMPRDHTKAFEGYHLPFIGYTFTEHSILNEKVNILDNDDDGDAFNGQNILLENEINKLKNENFELKKRLNETSLESSSTNNEDNQNLINVIKRLNDEIDDLKVKLNDLTQEYDLVKQTETEEKVKNRRLERNLRQIEGDKEALMREIKNLQEINQTQSKELQDSQLKCKLAVQEFTEQNDKVNELRSKNTKLTNDLIASDEKLYELKSLLNQKERLISDLERQLANSDDSMEQQNEDKPDKTPLIDELMKEINILKRENETLTLTQANLIDEMNKKFEYREIDSRNQHQNELDKLNSQIVKLTQEKRDLENELNMFINDKKETISKCESQMNEILQMVNEERLVRSHLKSLATKLIEEVDQLRSQCIYTTPSTALTTSNSVNNNSAHNEQWKNRNSEKRDRINVINLQVMLRKETQAKLDLMDENRTLKGEIDSKQNQINELKDQIDVYLTEIKNLNDKLEEINFKNNDNNLNINNNSNNQQLNGHLSIPNETQLKLDCHNECGSSTVLINSIMEPSKPVESSLKHSKSLKDYSNEISNNKLSTFSSKTLDPASIAHAKSHRFEVVTFNTMERCEYCCGILYGVCRQAVRCKEKNCNYLCHSKCRANLPENCPININQRVQLKGVDFNRGIGTLMQGSLKIPKLGTVKKGWQDHYVVLSNARLFICPIVDSKSGLIPVQIIDIRDPQFDVGPVNDYDVIHANKRDIPCIFRIFASKLKSPDLRQQILFCAKDENDKNNWITMLRDLNQRLKIMSRTQNSPQSIIFVSISLLLI